VHQEPTLSPERQLRNDLVDREAEVKQLEDEIQALERCLKRKRDEVNSIKQQLQSLNSSRIKSNERSGGMDYNSDKFEWDIALMSKSRAVFNITQFRLCQRGLVSRPPLEEH